MVLCRVEQTHTNSLFLWEMENMRKIPFVERKQKRENGKEEDITCLRSG